MSVLNLLLTVSLGYVVLLFGVAFAADRAARRGRGAWLRSPVIYTLSLSIYCTAWTFYGAVGFAARSGLEFVTIYLGPTLVMIGWWTILRRMVRIGRAQRITSIADMMSSRYGKSNLLAVFVTLIAVIGTTPYIALQLQSVTLSINAFAQTDPASDPAATSGFSTLWIAAGLALFTVLFGTRNLDVNERHHGVVMAIALEAVVKLCALLAVGIFVVWGLGQGPVDLLSRIDASEIATWEVSSGRWVGLTMLSAAAFLCLPRMFQVMVVENQDERHLRTAAWAFPTYLLLMSLFVVPIAVMGLELLPAGSNPDLFVLTLPLLAGQDGLAVFSFIGGFSSATSMVIVASIALSTMVSNHIVMPIWLKMTGGTAVMSGDVRSVALIARRLSIAAVVSLGYLYFRVSGGGTALAAIGLIAFVGVSQFLPALVGGLLWRGATRSGALAGLTIGFAVWLYCLFLPGLGAGAVIPQDVMDNGLFGQGWLRPYAMFGARGLDPVLHAMLWSLSLNLLTFVTVSILGFPSPQERLQGAQFVNVFEHSRISGGWHAGMAQSEDLLIMAQRIMGPEEARKLFGRAAAIQGLSGFLPEPTTDFIELLERELAGSVGSATAHAMISQIIGGAHVSVDDLLAVADETAQIMQYSSRLEAKSAELADTARQLQEVNAKLTQISIQKDGFLSQISHELRTPMTSIRAFSEILRDADGLGKEDQARYAGIIHDEAKRLTRLLDDLLDLSVLESGEIVLNRREGRLSDLLDRAIAATGGESSALVVHPAEGAEDVVLDTDLDRLAQVFINLVSNAQKYCDAPDPQLWLELHEIPGGVALDFIDNGSGVPPDHQQLIFEKFSRVGETRAGGAGLGLAICREIMARLGGQIRYLADAERPAFRVELSNEMLARPRAA
ncbi:sodium:solute symporter [Roseovarius sp. SCSIO 43702]|uniref:ATP-binding protein n=1 Tax=Roseovarius sp. SCSIO 43702 TaxID=2823043 RepID=UPI001C72EEBD|nr:ATP-binding protein [Roseovarius sp. SCSIO 43702]QYX56047.1 sodium:solute symporter [Roseovarius sp. SCSIO 43702]